MAFDWKSIVPIVASVAPVAGSILGGAIGGPLGATIGGKFGSIIAQQFGLPATATPGQVSDAMAAQTEETNRAKINAAMEIARAQIDGFTEIEKANIDALTQSVLGTQATMRVETQSQEPFFYRAWRPTAGWLFDVVMGIFGALLSWAIAKTVVVSATPLAVLSDAWPLLAAYIGALAVVNGVLIPSRTVEKKAAIENGAPMPNAVPAPVIREVPSIRNILPPLLARPPNQNSGSVRPADGVIPKPAGSRD